MEDPDSPNSLCSGERPRRQLDFCQAWHAGMPAPVCGFWREITGTSRAIIFLQIPVTYAGDMQRTRQGVRRGVGGVRRAIVS